MLQSTASSRVESEIGNAPLNLLASTHCQPMLISLDARIRKWRCAIESASSGSMTTYSAPSAKGSPNAVASHLRFGISDLITLDHFE